MKVAVITCYHDPDYIRARTLRAGLGQLTSVETVVVKNRRQGLGRYIEVWLKIIQTKFRDRPDVWLLTFRGYEILPFLLFIAGKTPVIFDELINLTEWVVDEHHKIKANSLAAQLLNWWYGRLLRKCRLILADTAAQAAYSARRSQVPIEKYRTIPVGTDETVFYPRPKIPQKNFQVFYYGSMLPLHGLDIVLAAASQLQDDRRISFLLVGGGRKTAASAAAAKTAGAHIVYQSWIPFEELPKVIAESQLCLAGPFGDTVQSQLVVTGKAYQFLASAAAIIIGKNKASTQFTNQKNSLVIPQGDATALAQAISWAADHPQQLSDIGQAGLALYQQEFSTTVIGAKLQHLLDQLSVAPGRESRGQLEIINPEKERKHRGQ